MDTLKSDFGKNAVDDFLRKITKRSYINEQIQYQLPETLDDYHELIKSGQKGNGLSALRELASTSSDDLGFIIFDEDEAGLRILRFSKNSFSQ